MGLQWDLDPDFRRKVQDCRKNNLHAAGVSDRNKSIHSLPEPRSLFSNPALEVLFYKLCLCRLICSLRIKRFCGVGEQRKTKERYFARAKLGREPK